MNRSLTHSTEQQTNAPTRQEMVSIARDWADRLDQIDITDAPEDRRWYFRLHYGDDYEVWLMGWNDEQSTDFHNHGGSSGAVVVARGALVESRLTHTGRATNRLVIEDHATWFGPDAIHNVYNAGLGRSISVHVYSPPLSSMTYFDQTNHGIVERETVAVDTPEPDGEELKPR